MIVTIRILSKSPGRNGIIPAFNVSRQPDFTPETLASIRLFKIASIDRIR